MRIESTKSNSLQSIKPIGYVLAALVALTALTPHAWAKKSQYATWNLKVVFYNASMDWSEATVQAKVAKWVQVAEQVFRRRPALKITYEIRRITHKAGKNLTNLRFDTDAQWAKFMEDHFDNVAVTKTEGHLTVLISDNACAGKDKDGNDDCWGGKAFFPHDVNPFSAKRGLSMTTVSNDYTFSHELGHMLSLKHTFEPYVGLNLQCNKSYKPKGRPGGECNSCSSGKIIYDDKNLPSRCDGRSNIMDYCTSAIDDEFLNACQEQRAANQRRQYMTKDGKTNYWRLKGLKGTPACKKDADCDKGRYCAKGALDVGRNQCLPLKKLGEGCTQAKQCGSGRCNSGKCKEAHECQNDSDCTNGICKKGPLGVGQNVCVATRSPTCPSGWAYETRNPLNKDRCRKTTARTTALKCKLLITDKAKNWTGPHAKSGADECRSKKGKKPKGVKCPSGYRHNIKSGADTCTKSDSDYQTPTCPSNYNYKSKSGRDICEAR